MEPDKRLQGVRDAYWDGSDENEFDVLRDTIVDCLGIDPSTDQVRAVFNLLPAEIIANVIRWGFRDTVVCEEAYVFIRKNQFAIRQQLGL